MSIHRDYRFSYEGESGDWDVYAAHKYQRRMQIKIGYIQTEESGYVAYPKCRNQLTKRDKDRLTGIDTRKDAAHLLLELTLKYGVLASNPNGKVIRINPFSI